MTAMMCFFVGKPNFLAILATHMKQAEVILKYAMNHATPRPGFAKQLWPMKSSGH